MPFKITRTVVMGGVAVLLTALTLFDLLSGGAGNPSSGRARSKPAAESGIAPVIAGSTSTPAGKRAEHSSASQLWQEIRTLSQLRENSPAVVRRYQALAAPYAEAMAEVAVLHGVDEKPEDAAKRALGALLPPSVQIKALLVADGAVSQQGNTLLTVNLSLESPDSLAMQQAIMMLGNPAAGLVWRELTLSADGDKRVIQLAGVLSALAVRYAE
jgi:hypothetical protein